MQHVPGLPLDFECCLQWFSRQACFARSKKRILHGWPQTLNPAQKSLLDTTEVFAAAMVRLSAWLELGIAVLCVSPSAL